MIFTCDLAKAKTIIPANLVIVIPDKTLLPVVDNDSPARCKCVPIANVYARTICDINSTLMPTH